MPLGTCADLDNPYLAIQREEPCPGGGSILFDVRFHHDGVSVRPNCDGPIIYLRARNTSPTVTARILLPNKKKGNPWIDGPPNSDVVLNPEVRQPDQNQLNNLGVTKASDVMGLTITFP